MNYLRDNNNIFVSLEEGDEVFESLYKVIDSEKIETGWINGLGTCKDTEIAFYNLDTKEYEKKIFDEHLEITNLTGNVTKLKDDPFLHLHITLSDYKYNAFGGHLFKAIITGACEIMIIVSDKSINRSYSDSVGLCLWNLKND